MAKQIEGVSERILSGAERNFWIRANLHKSLTFFRLFFRLISGTIFFTNEWSIWL